jgi:glycosyltransferase involved in cell wall biosynthesis
MNNKLSIITVCYNSELSISKTFDCVNRLKEKDFPIEYKVVDGNSTDGTFDIVQAYKGIIDKFISEEDSGIYNAMNKGLNLAKGKYISFLNADDQYITSDFDKILKIMEEDKYDYIFGNLVRDNGKNKTVSKPIPETRAKKYGYITPTFTQPASFIKKKVYDDIGGFDERFKIAGDTDFMVRLLLNKKYKGKYLDISITNFSTAGISSKLTNYREHKLIRDKYNLNYLKFYRFIIESSLKRSVSKVFKGAWLNLKYNLKN